MSKRRRTSKSVSFTEKRQRSRIPNLPEEIIFNIIHRESADFLHNVGRLVCKSWATIISKPKFIEMNLSHSNSFLLTNTSMLMNFVKSKSQRSKIQGKLLNSFAGLMLYKDSISLYVINSVTRQISRIPHCPKIKKYMRNMNVSYLPLTNRVKVICHYINPENRECLWKVFTVGTDTSWRELKNDTVNLKHLIISLILPRNPVVSLPVGGFIVCWTYAWICHNHFFVIDLDNESFHLVYWPSIHPPIYDSSRSGIIAMENKLYVISMKRDGREEVVIIWKLQDFNRSEWVQVFSIGIDYEDVPFGKAGKVSRYIAWFENSKILVFVTMKGAMKAYDFKERKIHHIISWYMMGLDKVEFDDYLLHPNSLVSW